jgi:conjugative transposon TraN protein
MNYKLVIQLIIFSSLLTHLQGQISIVSPKLDSIRAIALQVCSNKTTNLVFPYGIISVDRGSRDLLVQKAKGVENILQLKAGIETFEETNLSVITGDGKLYSFIIQYNPTPTLLNFQIQHDSLTSHEQVLPVLNSINEAGIEQDIALISEQRRSIHFHSDKKFKVKLQLKGIFIHQDVLYFQLRIRNLSAIGFEIDMLQMFTKDKKQALRTATQEISIEPIKIVGKQSIIPSDSSFEMVFACPKFTIPDKKWLIIQLMEKHGSRHLSMKVGNRPIVRARKILD